MEQNKLSARICCTKCKNMLLILIVPNEETKLKVVSIIAYCKGCAPIAILPQNFDCKNQDLSRAEASAVIDQQSWLKQEEELTRSSISQDVNHNP